MSRENVDVVRRWIAATSAGPQEARAAVAEFCDADVDYYPVRKFPEAQPCHGAGEVSQFFSRWLETWSRLDWAVQELIEVGDDRVLVCASLRAEGRGSGAKIEGDLYLCLWLRHGRIIRQEDHLTIRGALDALGLNGGTLEAAGLRASAMSQENVEAFREVIAAINEHGADARLDLLDPEIEFREDAKFPGAQVYRGRDEVVRNFREFTASFDYYRFEIEELRDAGGDKVTAVLHERARGKASGLEVDRRSGWVATFRDGKVLRFEIYLNPEEALVAVGLRE